MESKNLISTYNLLKRSLAAHHIGQAIGYLRTMATMSGSPWTVMRDIEQVDESYGYLRNYALDGVEDPSRGALLSELSASVRKISSMILRQADTVDSPRQYFSVLRYEAMQDDSSLVRLLQSYINNYDKFAMDALLGKSNETSSRKNLETASVRIFNLIWTSFPMSRDEVSALESVFTNETITEEFKELIVSALLLGALEYYDESKLILLAKVYLDGSPKLSIRALTALMLVMWAHRVALGGRRFKNVMSTVFEKTGWADDLKTVFVELVRTRDTERISRKLNDEIIPEMMRMRPDIVKKIGEINIDDEAMSLDGNPEWEEMFEQSGLSDKLKELSELQADGGDVMMSTFSSLKGFPFFNDVANWFLPFSADHSAVSAVVDNTANDIVELIASSPMMCDSDKYSIVLSLERIPAANRRMMLSQFKLQDINLSELRSSELNPEKISRKNICNKYIQDIYRFFKLYRRKSDFHNPFATPINLASIEMLSEYIDDADALTVVGEFYFKRGYWSEAIDIFNVLENRGEMSAQLLQKTGYCYQQTSRFNEAVDYYKRSELLRPDSLWTMRRLAQCYKAIGDIQSAIDYYRLIAEAKPDDLKIAWNMGNCYLEAADYENALKAYYKVEYLSTTPEKAYRPLAWCLFLTGDYDKSASYYEKVLFQNPTTSDYLNMGHLCMATGKYREAVNYYGLSRQNYDGGDTAFFKALDADRRYLESAHVKADMIDIVTDAVIN